MGKKEWATPAKQRRQGKEDVAATAAKGGRWQLMALKWLRATTTTTGGSGDRVIIKGCGSGEEGRSEVAAVVEQGEEGVGSKQRDQQERRGRQSRKRRA
ncbi:hypothetical protein B296_00052440 [Ensete ventricosum]|uniref:Uncharacterized protein n=1 Tax=Ensete ventricosum TaxID=4639 RepID=A0A426WVU4_ENSVE|nr:hypothetical protein B296_00052440 [Ensete ventricosum]